MRPASYKIVFITTPDLRTARKLAAAALSARLIACANLIPKIESHYRWKGRLEKGAEVLMICKTTTARLKAFEELVHRLHPYETPEFVVVKIHAGSMDYLKWLGDCCRSKG